MKRRSTRKAPEPTPFLSPPPAKPILSPPSDSPAIQFDFNFKGFNDVAPKSNSSKRTASKQMKATGLSPSPIQKSVKSVNSISDLKDLASSNAESVKRHLDRSHSEILKDIEASQCRLLKRYKMQSQACQQVMDEAEKEYKKMSERINEGRDAMKASYAEFIAEAQASTSRLCKTSIPELSHTVEKSMASLRSRYGILSTANI